MHDLSQDNCSDIVMVEQPVVDDINASLVNDLDNDITSAVIKAFCMVEDMGGSQ